MASVPLANAIMCIHRCSCTWVQRWALARRCNRTAVRVRFGRHAGRPGLGARSAGLRAFSSTLPRHSTWCWN